MLQEIEGIYGSRGAARLAYPAGVAVSAQRQGQLELLVYAELILDVSAEAIQGQRLLRPQGKLLQNLSMICGGADEAFNEVRHGRVHERII